MYDAIKLKLLSPFRPNVTNRDYYIPVTNRSIIYMLSAPERPESGYGYSSIRIVKFEGYWYIDSWPYWLELEEVKDILREKANSSI